MTENVVEDERRAHRGRLPPARGRPRARLAACGLALLLLAGCSSIQFAYDRADWFLVREASRWTCPTEPQRQTLRRLAGAVMRWHRARELPRYAQELRRLADALDRPLAREEFDRVGAAVEGAWSRALTGMADALIGYLAELGAPQVRCLADRLAVGENDAQRALLRDEPARLEEERRKTLSFLEPWVGSLTEAQKRIVTDSVEGRATALGVAAANRGAAARFLALLAERDPGTRRARLASVLRARYGLYSNAEQALLEGRARHRREALWSLAKTLTAPQRATLRTRLHSLARDFEELARRGGR